MILKDASKEEPFSWLILQKRVGISNGGIVVVITVISDAREQHISHCEIVSGEASGGAL